MIGKKLLSRFIQIDRAGIEYAGLQKIKSGVLLIEEAVLIRYKWMCKVTVFETEVNLWKGSGGYNR